ncbi:MAG: hypothetical protein L3J75_00850 [Methylococcaceae bacterium]|nr:hypothetical protein [Methylococcaceae bacterium]
MSWAVQFTVTHSLGERKSLYKKISALFIGITPQLDSEEINREKRGFFLELDRGLI